MKNKIIIIFLLLTSCGSFSDAGKALRNEKTVTTDEFLIERRGPLSIPPNMNELPKPKTKTNTSTNSEVTVFGSDIKKSNSGANSSLENIFLEEMKKN